MFGERNKASESYRKFAVVDEVGLLTDENQVFDGRFCPQQIPDKRHFTKMRCPPSVKRVMTVSFAIIAGRDRA